MSALPSLLLRLLVVLTILAGAPAQANEEEALTEAQRLLAARLAGDYLVRIIDDKGRFIYSYSPFDRQMSKEYNLLRHAGTIHALCQLYDATQLDVYRTAAARAAALLHDFVQEVDIEGRRHTVLISDPAFTKVGADRGRTVKTGGCALAIIALLGVDRIRGTSEYTESCRKLASYLSFTQMANGNLRSVYLLKEEHFDAWQSLFYPGQALMALGMLQRNHDDPHLHETMQRLMLYLAVKWQIDLANPEYRGDFDHWSLMGLEATFDLLKDEQLAAYSPAQSVWTRQRLLETATEYIDLEWLDFIHGRDAGAALDGAVAACGSDITPAATRMEGIQSVYRLLQAAGQRPEKWDELMQRRLQFILRAQYSARDAVRIGGPLPFAGAFRCSVLLNYQQSQEIRIDYVQHAISALLNR